jgi:hypothetical protein
VAKCHRVLFLDARMSRENLTRISVFIFRLTGNVHPTASECNVQSSFQCWVLPRTTEGVSFMSPENPKARKWRFTENGPRLR